MKTRSLIIALVLACRLAWAAPFTLPILPDTQCELNAAYPNTPAMFTSQMNWLATNKTALSIPIVLHVGDIIDFDTDDAHGGAHYMWIRASTGFAILDNAGLAYALALGNHDTGAVFNSGGAAPGDVNINVRDTTQFNSFFPVSRLTAQRGRYESGKSENAWYTFSAGGVQWLVITLEYCARQAPVDWAKKIVEDHPAHNVIFVTHYHLTGAGAINTNTGGYGDLNPLQIYDQLIKQYSNVRFVFSGHVDSSATRNDPGVFGNRIYQVLQDYQGTDLGGGYIRLMDIDTTAGTVAGRMYSPYYNLTKTGASQFSFTGVNFIKNTVYTSAARFRNTAFYAAQTGTFSASFDATPSLAGSNSIVALCKGAQTAYTGHAVAIRFNPSGYIDARNGGAYGVSTIPYTAGATYHFRLVVDVPNHRYSAYVTPPNGTELTIGTNYSFRTEQNTVTSLDTVNVDVNPTPGGSLTVCPVMIFKPLVPAKHTGVTVTASADDGNVASNALDGNLATRWSATGNPQWLQFDLGSTKTFSSLKLAWFLGNTRVATYDIQTSVNNISWKTVVTGGTSSGTTTALETIDIPDIAARYIRVICHGNNLNTDNGITEGEVWGL
ncbi:MAG: discoidin domain-containing protein [Opitutae bacterium]|nr:discoidin domain-containing protein [Opitutae bacterium]